MYYTLLIDKLADGLDFTSQDSQWVSILELRLTTSLIEMQSSLKNKKKGESSFREGEFISLQVTLMIMIVAATANIS